VTIHATRRDASYVTRMASMIHADVDEVVWMAFRATGMSYALTKGQPARFIAALHEAVGFNDAFVANDKMILRVERLTTLTPQEPTADYQRNQELHQLPRTEDNPNK